MGWQVTGIRAPARSHPDTASCEVIGGRFNGPISWLHPPLFARWEGSEPPMGTSVVSVAPCRQGAAVNRSVFPSHWPRTLSARKLVLVLYAAHLGQLPTI